MSWKDRLRPSITLVSPTGQNFEAKWRGNDITIQKRVNRVSHPEKDGDTAQDLGLNSPDVPLNIYFDGPDHDTEGLRFSRALGERGVWEITHPVYGLMSLQPVKITIHSQPVESGNITEASGEWFEPVPGASGAGVSSIGPVSSAFLPPVGSVPYLALSRFQSAAGFRTVTGFRAAAPGAAGSARSGASPAGSAGPGADPAAAVQSAASALDEAAQADAAQITPKITAGAGGSAVSQSGARRAVTGVFHKNLEAVNSTLRTKNAGISAIMGNINELLMRPYLDISALTGSVIRLIRSPGLFLGNMASRVSMYVRLGKRIITDIPAAFNFTRDMVAAALTGELWINAVASGLGIAVTSGLPETRAEALSVLSQCRDFATLSRNALDALAKASAAWPVEAQYFPRATSAEAALTMNAAISRYILSAAFNLRAEKRITLERPTSPLLLAIREYGANAAGADAAFDLLCRSNNLHGRELLLLPAGREVAIYV